MAVNQFLPFCTGGGANVIDQVTYSGLAARSSGFSAGTAQSAQLNKVWRQSSIMAAVLAQFISDRTGQDALDDGTTDTLLANLKLAAPALLVSPLGPSSQISAIVGNSASSSLTFTDEQVVVGSALNGSRWALPTFSQTLNIGTTGAGGMDTGSAPVSGFVAVYAGLNTTTGARTVFAQTVGGSAPSTIYSGANAPAGYNATGLISILPTNGAGQFPAYVFQVGRSIAFPTVSVLTGGSGGIAPTYTAVGIANAAPRGAKAVSGNSQVTATAAGNNATIASNIGGGGSIPNSPISSGQQNSPFRILLAESQRFYYQATSSVINVNIFVSSYEF